MWSPVQSYDLSKWNELDFAVYGFFRAKIPVVMAKKNSDLIRSRRVPFLLFFSRLQQVQKTETVGLVAVPSYEVICKYLGHPRHPHNTNIIHGITFKETSHSCRYEFTAFCFPGFHTLTNNLAPKNLPIKNFPNPSSCCRAASLVSSLCLYRSH